MDSLQCFNNLCSVLNYMAWDWYFPDVWSQTFGYKLINLFWDIRVGGPEICTFLGPLFILWRFLGPPLNVPNFCVQWPVMTIITPFLAWPDIIAFWRIWTVRIFSSWYFNVCTIHWGTYSTICRARPALIYTIVYMCICFAIG